MDIYVNIYVYSLLTELSGKLYIYMVFPVVMYGCESWTVKEAEHRRIDAFELWCWRRLLSPLDCKENQPVHSEGDQPWDFLFFFLLYFYFYFIFKLYNIVLVLPNIEMNPPQVYLCSPS